MALNVSKTTLSEYRITQNPVWQEVLANAIAEDIFLDAFFPPEEVEAVVDFMGHLDENKRGLLERTIRHGEASEFKRSFLLSLAHFNRYKTFGSSVGGQWLGAERTRTPAEVMMTKTYKRERAGTELTEECSSSFGFFSIKNVGGAFVSAARSVYGVEIDSPDGTKIWDWVHEDGVELPMASFGNPSEEDFLQPDIFIGAKELCEEIVFYCPTFECEGLE